VTGLRFLPPGGAVRAPVYPWPPLTAAGLASGLRWLILVLALAGLYLVWAAWGSRASSVAPSSEPESSVT